MKNRLVDDPNRIPESAQKEPVRKKVFRIISIVLFWLGVSVGMVLLGGSVYADFESMLSNISVNSEDTIRPVSCPIALALQEEGRISALIKNSSESPINSLVQVQIRKGYISHIHAEKERLELPPSDSEQFYWEISSGEDFTGILLINVISLERGDATHKGSCGIYIIDLPFGLIGRQASVMLLAFSILSMLFGLYLWWRNARRDSRRRIEAARSFSGLMIIIILGLLFSFIGYWEVGAVFFYIALLMIGVIVPHFMISR